MAENNNPRFKKSGDVVNYSGERYLDRILPVRLPSAKLELIRQEARELGTTPSALARIWILDSLRNIGPKENGPKNSKSRRA